MAAMQRASRAPSSGERHNVRNARQDRVSDWGLVPSWSSLDEKIYHAYNVVCCTIVCLQIVRQAVL